MKILKHISRGPEDFSAWRWKWPRRAPHHLKDYWVTSAEGRVYDGDCTTSWPSEGVSYRSLIGGWIITPHPGNVLFTANYEGAGTLQGPLGPNKNKWIQYFPTGFKSVGSGITSNHTGSSKVFTRVRTVDLLAKCLPCSYESLSFISSAHIKRPGIMAYAGNPHTDMYRNIAGAYQPVNLT